MEKYLISLLDQNNRVIVPDLGAFIIRQNEPKDLVFNDLLAFDDGMLTDKIMLEDNIQKAEAQARIKQFVEKARRRLETGETFPLEDIGFLRMDASSRIEFLSNTADPEPEKKETKKPEEEIEDQPEETLGDTEHSDYEAEYLKLMSSGKKPKKSKPKAKEKEPETVVPVADTLDAEHPETESSETKATETKEPDNEVHEALVPEAEVPEAETPEVEGPEAEVPEVEPIIEEPLTETKKQGKQVVETGEEDGFILDDGDSEIEVDATSEDTPLRPDNEESIFQIDEEATKSEAEESEDSFKEAIAEETDTLEELTEVEDTDITKDKLTAESEEKPGTESKSDMKLSMADQTEEVPEPEQESEPEKETEPSAVDQVRAAEEARAIAEERAAMLAARQEKMQEEKPVSTYANTEDKKKRAWPRILGFAALIIIILAIGWFMFPDIVHNLFTKDKAKITLEDQSGEAIDQPVSDAEEADVPEETQVPSQLPEQEEASSQSDLVLEQEPENEPEPVTASRPAGKQYHIVAGSFANLSNAEKFVRNLRDQGFDASIIGKRNNLHTVCFSSHSTKNAAEDELARIRSNIDAQAWLLYY